MGFSDHHHHHHHHQVVEGLELDNKKWVIAGIQLRAPLKQIYTNPVDQKETESDQELSTTPTSEEARIPARTTCPPAPRKRKVTLKCNYGGVREFFNPPDLETVFIRKVVERAAN